MIKLPQPFQTSCEVSGRVSSADIHVTISTDGKLFQAEVITEFDMRDRFFEFGYWPEELVAEKANLTLHGLARSLARNDKALYEEIWTRIAVYFDENLSDIYEEHDAAKPSLAHYLQLESDECASARRLARMEYSEAHGEYDLNSVLMYKKKRGKWVEWTVHLMLIFDSHGWKVTLTGHECDGSLTFNKSIVSPSLNKLFNRLAKDYGLQYWQWQIQHKLDLLFCERLSETTRQWNENEPSLESYLRQERELARHSKRLKYLRQKYREAYDDYEAVAMETPRCYNDARAVRLTFSENGWEGALFEPSDTEAIHYNSCAIVEGETLDEILCEGDYHDLSHFDISDLANQMVRDDSRWLPFVLEYLVETETLED